MAESGYRRSLTVPVMEDFAFTYPDRQNNPVNRPSARSVVFICGETWMCESTIGVIHRLAAGLMKYLSPVQVRDTSLYLFR